MRLLDPRGHHPAREAVAEKVFADINGVRQGMFIQRAGPGRPVLLFLHGGLPEFFLTDRYPTGLANDFTVAWWEQRGAGLSYSPAIPPETMTAEQFIADTLSVTDYLRNRFDQEKIYLMAHSGGTFLGLQAAARAPEKYHAYIGVAQVVDQRRSEALAYEYMLERFRQDGNRGMARRLEAAPVTMEDGISRRYLAVRDRAMHTLGVGTTRDMSSVFRGVIWPSLLSPHYTLAEKAGLWRGKRASGVSALWDEMLATDLTERVPELDLPAYFLHGICDHTISYELAKAYAEKLRAPLKGFYTFYQSAHSPLFEEPHKACRIMCDDVLTGTTNLADT
jgi:pimeloyl-ACP methyl ester carboxylesterase